MILWREKAKVCLNAEVLDTQTALASLCSDEEMAGLIQ